MTSQRSILRLARRATLVLSLVGVGYLFFRFDVQMVSEDSCCPVTNYVPGDRLVIDKRPSVLRAGDPVLISVAGGGLVLAKIERIRADDGALWCISDREDCPGFDSAQNGWVARTAIAGRVLLGWGG